MMRVDNENAVALVKVKGQGARKTENRGRP